MALTIDQLRSLISKNQSQIEAFDQTARKLMEKISDLDNSIAEQTKFLEKSKRNLANINAQIEETETTINSAEASITANERTIATSEIQKTLMAKPLTGLDLSGPNNKDKKALDDWMREETNAAIAKEYKEVVSRLEEAISDVAEREDKNATLRSSNDELVLKLAEDKKTSKENTADIKEREDILKSQTTEKSRLEADPVLLQRSQLVEATKELQIQLDEATIERRENILADEGSSAYSVSPQERFNSANQLRSAAKSAIIQKSAHEAYIAEGTLRLKESEKGTYVLKGDKNGLDLIGHGSELDALWMMLYGGEPDVTGVVAEQFPFNVRDVRDSMESLNESYDRRQEEHKVETGQNTKARANLKFVELIEENNEAAGFVYPKGTIHNLGNINYLYTDGSANSEVTKQTGNILEERLLPKIYDAAEQHENVLHAYNKTKSKNDILNTVVEKDIEKFLKEFGDGKTDDDKEFIKQLKELLETTGENGSSKTILQALKDNEANALENMANKLEAIRAELDSTIKSFNQYTAINLEVPIMESVGAIDDFERVSSRKAPEATAHAFETNQSFENNAVFGGNNAIATNVLAVRHINFTGFSSSTLQSWELLYNNGQSEIGQLPLLLAVQRNPGNADEFDKLNGGGIGDHLLRLETFRATLTESHAQLGKEWPSIGEFVIEYQLKVDSTNRYKEDVDAVLSNVFSAEDLTARKSLLVANKLNIPHASISKTLAQMHMTDAPTILKAIKGAVEKGQMKVMIEGYVEASLAKILIDEHGYTLKEIRDSIDYKTGKSDAAVNRVTGQVIGNVNVATEISWEDAIADVAAASVEGGSWDNVEAWNNAVSGKDSAKESAHHDELEHAKAILNPGAHMA